MYTLCIWSVVERKTKLNLDILFLNMERVYSSFQKIISSIWNNNNSQKIQVNVVYEWCVLFIEKHASNVSVSWYHGRVKCVILKRLFEFSDVQYLLEVHQNKAWMFNIFYIHLEAPNLKLKPIWNPWKYNAELWTYLQRSQSKRSVQSKIENFLYILQSEQ